MLALLIVICALFGLAVGSFLNVVIYRVPHHESIVSPRSKCPSCQSPIRERDNIPVLSWLILRGRCRDCRAPISARYLVVELLGGALFAGLAGRLGYNWDLPAFLALLSGLLALSCIDMEHLTLPKKVVYPTLVLEAIFLVIAAAAYDSWHRLLIAALCGASWFAAFFLINLASPPRARVRRRSSRRSPRPRLGVVRVALCRLGVLRRESHRGRRRHLPDRDQAHRAQATCSLRRVLSAGHGVRDLRRTRDRGALRPVSLATS